MSDLLKSIDARTRLAGTNKLEILLFSLGEDAVSGRREIFGINVFKVREVIRRGEITAAPEMPECVEGMVSLRGTLVPVVDLGKYVGIKDETPRNVMIITEYNGKTQGFLVEAVDTILRLDWSQMRVPPDMLTANLGGLVTAVTELPGNKLVMMLDVEKVLAETTRYAEGEEFLFKGIEPVQNETRMVVYADDSSIARKQIERTLQALNVPGRGAVNGHMAWQMLQQIANQCQASGVPVTDRVAAILTDVEMPEMDGYMLTKSVKSDERFNGVPVLMHSSLSGMSNQQLGKSVGVDEYIPKFEPQRLSATLRRLMERGSEGEQE